MNPARFPLRLATLLLLAGSLAPTGALHAQEPPKIVFPAASPAASLKQRIGVVDVEVEYSRPGKNGREIFGSLVPYHEVWRTGANASTKITFSDAVRIVDKEIPAGKYALYTVPTPGDWVIIIYKDLSLWGAYKYKQSDDVARVTVKPETLPSPVETFTIGFDDVKEDGATMFLAWDRVRVPVRLTVDTVGKVSAAIAKATAPGAEPPPNPQLLAQAAGFYLGHNLDLAKALEWINAAIEKLPPSYPLYERKARIQAKMGDKAGAAASAQKALELVKANPAEADPATALNLQKFIESLR